MSGIELDFAELSEQVRLMDEQLGELLSQVEKAHGQEVPVEEEGFNPEPSEEPRLGSAEQQRIEEAFERAEKDRSKAFELKQELDRLGVFKDYENRFLDLFKKTE